MEKTILWFCENCKAANNLDVLECTQCGGACTAETLFFNADEFRSARPIDYIAEPDEPYKPDYSPYFVDGGVSFRESDYRSVWK